MDSTKSFSFVLIQNVLIPHSNMRVVDLKSLTKERGLIGYSGIRKAELIELLQNNPPPAPNPQARPPAPTT